MPVKGVVEMAVGRVIAYRVGWCWSSGWSCGQAKRKFPFNTKVSQLFTRVSCTLRTPSRDVPSAHVPSACRICNRMRYPLLSYCRIADSTETHCIMLAASSPSHRRRHIPHQVAFLQ
jgi:hypothetical protein